MGQQTGWRIWWAKRRWYERNHRLARRLRIDRHAARGGFFIRYPVEGEILEALDEGRLRIGEGTLLEPGCWLTLAPEGEIEIGEGCFLNRGTMIAAQGKVTVNEPEVVLDTAKLSPVDPRQSAFGGILQGAALSDLARQVMLQPGPSTLAIADYCSKVSAASTKASGVAAISTSPFCP